MYSEYMPSASEVVRFRAEAQAARRQEAEAEQRAEARLARVEEVMIGKC